LTAHGLEIQYQGGDNGREEGHIVTALTYLEDISSHVVPQIQHCLMLYLGSNQLIPTNSYYDTLTILNVSKVVNRTTVNLDTVDQFTRFTGTNWLAVYIAGPNTFQIDVKIAFEPDSDALYNVFMCGGRSN
jgi:hypothetical protein